jgi:hypothetical protein
VHKSKRLDDLGRLYRKNQVYKKISEEKALEIALAKLPENLANFVKMKERKRKEGDIRPNLNPWQFPFITQVVKHTECCRNCIFCQQKHHSGITYQNYQLPLAFPKAHLILSIAKFRI